MVARVKIAYPRLDSSPSPRILRLPWMVCTWIRLPILGRKVHLRSSHDLLKSMLETAQKVVATGLQMILIGGLILRQHFDFLPHILRIALQGCIISRGNKRQSAKQRVLHRSRHWTLLPEKRVTVALLPKDPACRGMVLGKGLLWQLLDWIIFIHPAKEGMSDHGTWARLPETHWINSKVLQCV